nr:protein TPR3-like isoform X2 [Ziziphus jujuba var. spinosa]
MSTSQKDLYFLLLKFFDEEGLEGTAHMLECETQCYFDMRYFEEMMLSGNWYEAEKYFSSFTKTDDNSHSNDVILLVVNCGKFLKALDRKDHATAEEILKKDLKEFKDMNEDLFNEMALLLTSDDTRKHPFLSDYKFKSARKNVVLEMKRMIEANAFFDGKLNFHNIETERLRCLTNQIDPDQTHILLPTVHNYLPMTLTQTLNFSSSPISMNFHPTKHTLLLVGTSIGDITLWDVSSGKRLLAKNYMKSKVSVDKELCASVKRILWSPDGTFFGVAYSKHVLQVYSYSESNDIYLQWEWIYAHMGGINDLAFSSYENQLLLITCGDDKKIKVWDVDTGNKQFTFRGHNAPVSSVCPTSSNQYQWMARLKHGNTKHLSPSLISKLLVLGTQKWLIVLIIKGRKTFLVEWSQCKDSVRRTYHGLQASSSSAVQFDIANNQFLAAGHDHKIKFWDMDNVEPLITIDAEGGLPETPSICFNRKGTLLAVVANENRIKILATNYGIGLLQTTNKHSADASREISETVRKYTDTKDAEDVAVLVSPGVNVKEKVGKFLEIKNTQCQSLRLHNPVEPDEISRLIYTNKGDAVLALASNVHLLWKWLGDEATTKVQPSFTQPQDALPMINDVDGINHEVAVPCFALSKNDSYLVSASGGMISLFNTLTFQNLVTFMPPPPAATCIAFQPQDNNIVAIGKHDSTIIIFNCQRQKVLAKLEGHTKRVTGLAFCKTKNVLISSGADTQVFAWNFERWKKWKSTFLQVGGKKLESLSDTHIQFHQDQLHFLAVHKNFLGIYEADTLNCVKWAQGFLSGPISSATFSADCQIVYTSFQNGMIVIFDALELIPFRQISPNTYLHSFGSHFSYPLVIAAHPKKSAQFAIGLSSGEVCVIEPSNPTGQWDFDDSKVPDSLVE